MKEPKRPESLKRAELIGAAVLSLVWKEDNKYILSDRSGNIKEVFYGMADELPERFRICISKTFHPRKRPWIKKQKKLDIGGMIVKDFLWGLNANKY